MVWRTCFILVLLQTYQLNSAVIIITAPEDGATDNYTSDNMSDKNNIISDYSDIDTIMDNLNFTTIENDVRFTDNYTSDKNIDISDKNNTISDYSDIDTIMDNLNFTALENEVKITDNYTSDKNIDISDKNNTLSDYADINLISIMNNVTKIPDYLDIASTPDNLDITQDNLDSAHIFENMNLNELWQKHVKNLSTEFLELDPAQMIAQHGYPAESHQVTTEDGYILTVHRIPSKLNKGQGQGHPVLLQHGLLASAADWIILGPGRGLAYVLSDLGYDVWLGNCRGNTYSRAHVNISASDKAFWNFTWHEMGYYDLPAVTEFILSTSGHPQLTYIGHSMGTTMFWVFCTTRPELQHRVRQMHALAPIAFMSRMKSPLRNLSPFVRELQISLPLLGEYEFLPHGGPSTFLVREFLKINHMAAETSAEYVFFYICGFDPAEFNKTLLPNILGHTPAGASTQAVIHYMQEVKSGKFRAYDEGTTAGNLHRYGVPEPPEYDLSQLEVPVAMQYSLNDWLSNTDDVKELFQKLKNPIGMFQVPLKSFNHLDYLFANDARKLVYQKVIDLMKNTKIYSDKVKVHVKPLNNALITSLAPVIKSLGTQVQKISGGRDFGLSGFLSQIDRFQSRLKTLDQSAVPAPNKPLTLLGVKPAPLVSRMLSTLIADRRSKAGTSNKTSKMSLSEMNAAIQPGCKCSCGGTPSHLCQTDKPCRS